MSLARPLGGYVNPAGTIYVSGTSTLSFYVAQDLTFADNSNYGYGPTTARTYYQVYPAGTAAPPWPPTPPPVNPAQPEYPATPPPKDFLLASKPFTLQPPDGAYDIYYYSVDVVDREATLNLSQFILDTTPPAIAITVPSAAAPYPHSATLTLNYGATDSGSGVASVTATIDGNPTVASGQPIVLDSLKLGKHTFTVTAIDHVGNQSVASTTFTLIRIATQCNIYANPAWLNGTTAVALTADVTPTTSVPGAPTGMVAFWDSDFQYSDTDMGSAPIVNDQASLTVTLVPKPNPQWVKAVYNNGDQNFVGCTSPWTALPKQ